MMSQFFKTVVVLVLSFTLFEVYSQRNSEINLKPDIRFEENKGQITNLEGDVQCDILFTLKDQGMNVYFRRNSISYQWYYVENLDDITKPISEATGGLPYSENEDFVPAQSIKSKNTVLRTYRVDMQWLNTNDNVEILSEEPYDDYTNYYHAHSPEGIHYVKSFSRISYKNIYPGIDISYYLKNGTLKYDLHVSAGADISNVKFEYSGLQPKLENGNIKIQSPLGWIEEQQPVAWDEAGKPLCISYYEKGGVLGFIGDQSDKAFIIDPPVVWATYYGGLLADGAGTSSVDGSGNLYFSGGASSVSGIATSSGHQDILGGGTGDAFLVKFSSLGVRQWSTYYGGTGNEDYQSCAVDNSGNVFLGGLTTSTSGISSGGHQNSIGGDADAFIVKFSPSGVRQWGTYYGGSLEENYPLIAADGSGNVFLSGYTFSTSGIATAGGHQPTLGGQKDAFLVKFLSDGTRDWGTYYGGTGNDEGQACTADASGNVYLTGWTGSSSGMATSGAHKETRESTDAFLVKFSSSGSRAWGTYYGGSSTDAAYGVSTAGTSVYMIGWTKSLSGIASGGHQNTHGGDQDDAFLVKFSSDGIRQWGTYYGGTADDQAAACKTDATGNVYISGRTESTSNIASGCRQNTFGGGTTDAFLVKFSSTGSRQWSTYYGGVGEDRSRDVSVDGSGNVYLTGFTKSDKGIASASGVHQSVFGGDSDAFIAKFTSTDATPPQILQNTTPLQAINGSSVEVSVSIADAESGISDVLISYGPATSTTFEMTDATMTNSTGNSYVFTIPSSVQSQLGVRYEIKATNSVCLTTTSSPFLVSAIYNDPGLTIPYNAPGTSQSNYRMISIPLNLQNKTVNGTLGDDLEPYGDKSKWRLWNFDNTTDKPVELSGSTSLDYRKGYWLISAENKVLDSGNGQSIGSVDDPVRINVGAGWNLIGNPYPFNILWSDVTSFGANSSLGIGTLNIYSGSYNNPSILKAFEGAFVMANTAGELVIPAAKNPAAGGRVQNDDENLRYYSIDTDDWEVRFRLQTEEMTYNLSGIGVHPEASDTYDTFDGFTLPRFGDYLELNHNKLIHDKIPYARDIIAPVINHKWEFNVQSSSTEKVILKWDNEHFQNSHKQLVLWVKDKQLPINMALTNSYSFTGPQSFIALYGDANFINESTGSFGLHLLDPYPNPSIGVLEIDFIVPENFHEGIMIDLVDAFGKNVLTIANKNYTPGHHHLTLNTNEIGTNISSGMHLLRIQGGNQIQYKKVILK